MVDTTIVHGVYKPTNITGVNHLVAYQLFIPNMTLMSECQTLSIFTTYDSWASRSAAAQEGAMDGFDEKLDRKAKPCFGCPQAGHPGPFLRGAASASLDSSWSSLIALTSRLAYFAKFLQGPASGSKLRYTMIYHDIPSLSMIPLPSTSVNHRLPSMA